MYAGNAARFEQSYREIADRAKIHGREDPNANVFKLVYDWLQDAENGNWVVILDNVDDDDFLRTPILPSSPNSILKQPLKTYLPRGHHGLLIVTSRRTDVAMRIVDKRDIIAVNTMEEPEALALMQKTLELPTSEADIMKLTEALDYVPLALIQAAAYLNKREGLVSVPQYVEKLQGSDHSGAELLSHEAGDLQRDWEANNSILKTWQISFDHISNMRPSAADLLALMSFFDRQGIPEELLRDIKIRIHDNDSDAVSDDDCSDFDANENFMKDIVTLRDYSFISKTPNIKAFGMHRLVQLSTRRWLEADSLLEHWKELSITRLYEAFPSGDWGTWEKCELLFPHVKLAMSQEPKLDKSCQVFASLLQKAACYVCSKGKMTDMEKIACKMVEIRKGCFGAEHRDTLQSMDILVSVFRSIGRIQDAEVMSLQVVEKMKRVLGAEDPDTLMAMRNLANTLLGLGRFQEAKEISEQVVNLHTSRLGVEHGQTSDSIHVLARAVFRLGHFQQAEALFIQVLDIRKRMLGVEHPGTLQVMNDLAYAMREQHRFQETEEILTRVVDAQKRVLGVEHPGTLVGMIDLALTINSQSKFQEAEEQFTRALEVRKRVLGAEHPDTLSATTNLAILVYEQG